MDKTSFNGKGLRMSKKIIIPIPSRDFDPTECAIP